MNQDAEEELEMLAGILDEALDGTDHFGFEHLRTHETFPPFVPPNWSAQDIIQPPQPESYLGAVKPLKWFDRLIPGAKARYDRAVVSAAESYQEALKVYSQKEAARKQQLEESQASYEAAKLEFDEKKRKQNEQVDEFEGAYKKGDEEAIVAYNTAALQHTTYPPSFPQNFRVGYSWSSVGGRIKTSQLGSD